MDIPRFLQDFQMRGRGRGFNLSNYSVSPGNTISRSRPTMASLQWLQIKNKCREMPGLLSAVLRSQPSAETLEERGRKRERRREGDKLEKKSLSESDGAVDKKFFWNGLPHHHEIGFSAPNQERWSSDHPSFFNLFPLCLSFFLSFNLI